MLTHGLCTVNTCWSPLKEPVGPLFQVEFEYHVIEKNNKSLLEIKKKLKFPTLSRTPRSTAAQTELYTSTQTATRVCPWVVTAKRSHGVFWENGKTQDFTLPFLFSLNWELMSVMWWSNGLGDYVDDRIRQIGQDRSGLQEWYLLKSGQHPYACLPVWITSVKTSLPSYFHSLSYQGIQPPQSDKGNLMLGSSRVLLQRFISKLWHEARNPVV